MPQGPGPEITAIAAGRLQLTLTVMDLWLGYISVGGDRPLPALRSWLTGAADLPDRDYDFLAQALNDRFVDEGGNHPVPYSDGSSFVGAEGFEPPTSAL